MQMEEDESMKLELDLDGVILELEIKGLARRYYLDDADDIFDLQLFAYFYNGRFKYITH